MVYAPADRDLEVDLSNDHGEFVVEWFNPVTGISIEGGATTGGT